MTRVGVIFDPYVHDPSVLVGVARDAQDAGIDELWLWEDCFRESGIASAAVALAVTSRLHVGIGILPMPLRTVAVTAMEVATLARIFPGRFLPGFGHGVQAWMAQAGVRAASPLTLMREYLTALRRLLAGEEVTAQGRYVTLDAVRLAVAPQIVPRVYSAAEGPKTLAAAGEVADGVVLDSRHSAAELGEMVGVVQAGRAAPADVVAYTVCAFGADADSAVRAALGERGIDGDRALWGSVDEVAAGVARVGAAGIDSVVLLPAGDTPFDEYLRCAGAVRARVADA